MFLRIAPVFTSDAVVLGILLTVLALIFYTSSLKSAGWKKFYLYVPGLLLAYFIPALLNYPLGLIAPHWYDAGLMDVLACLKTMKDYNYLKVLDMMEKLLF